VVNNIVEVVRILFFCGVLLSCCGVVMGYQYLVTAWFISTGKLN
jgi:hypothetical protein